jgi:Tfp pilus assembly protein FimT
MIKGQYSSRFHRLAAFTLAELVVTVGVLALLVLLFTQLLNVAANVTTLGHKQMDADSQAR